MIFTIKLTHMSAEFQLKLGNSNAAIKQSLAQSRFGKSHAGCEALSRMETIFARFVRGREARDRLEHFGHFSHALKSILVLAPQACPRKINFPDMHLRQLTSGTCLTQIEDSQGCPESNIPHHSGSTAKHSNYSLNHVPWAHAHQDPLSVSIP